MKFRTILADPPWTYSNGRHDNGSRARTVAKMELCVYPTMTNDSICALPVSSVAANDSALLLWCTWPQLEVGLRVINAWGFTYKSGFPWVKMTAASVPRSGMGFHGRSASEIVLVGTKGRCVPPPENRQVAVIFSPIGRHSAKPDAQYTFAEAYGGPYLEMFARPTGGLFPAREEWTQIGNEITGRDIATDLVLLAKQEILK